MGFPCSGRPALPPAWSFGLWLTTSFTTDYDEETVTGFIQGMADRDRTAADVEIRLVDLEHPSAGERLCGKRFIKFDQIDVVQGETCSL